MVKRHVPRWKPVKGDDGPRPLNKRFTFHGLNRWKDLHDYCMNGGWNRMPFHDGSWRPDFNDAQLDA